MVVRRKFPALCVAFGMMVGCGSDGSPQGTDDNEIESGDAGENAEADESADSGARDAPTEDAGQAHDGKVLEHTSDAAASARDAGHDESGDAGATTSHDAGPIAEHDAGTSPGHDAGPIAEHDASVGHDAGGSDASAATSCADLTYESYGKAFVATNCISCHGVTGHSPKLDSLTGIQNAKEMLKSEVLNKNMPAGKSDLTDAQRAQFGAWIDCGPH